MSEAIPGMPPPPPPATPRDAAIILLFRRAPGGVELYWMRREVSLSFAGGFYAFPGGGVDKRDPLIPVEGATGLEATLRAAAARELLEETGVLVAEGAESLSPERIIELRHQLLDEKKSFGDILKENGLRLRAADFPDAGRWVTPEALPRRFDARTFLVEAPANAQPERWPGELAEGAWIRPADAVRRWEEGRALLHPPALHALRVMAEFTSVPEACAQLKAPLYCRDFIPQRIEFQQGIRVLPLRTPTLLPATHTNCYVVGNGELLVVDPGAPDDDEINRLVTHLRALEADGLKVKAVFLTHHHGDHVGSARALKGRMGLPVWCHARTADRLHFPADRLLDEGDVVELAGTPPMRFRVLHTPGHARGHLCLVHELSRAALVGDMVAGVGTILIDPPEGDMAEYLRQLARLEALPVGALYPAHGPTLPDGPAKLREYLQHRAMREAKILGAIPARGATLEEIVAKGYDDVAAFVHPIAERSTVAILEKLLAEGRVQREGERYVTR